MPSHQDRVRQNNCDHKYFMFMRLEVKDKIEYATVGKQCRLYDKIIIINKTSRPDPFWDLKTLDFSVYRDSTISEKHSDPD